MLSYQRPARICPGQLARSFSPDLIPPQSLPEWELPQVLRRIQSFCQRSAVDLGGSYFAQKERVVSGMA